jgi:protein arginine kinase activator
MLCDKCGVADAVYTKITIINNEKKTEHLCQNCYSSQFKSNLSMDFSNSIQQAFADFFDTSSFANPMTAQTSKVLKCQTCGLTYNQFLETGRLGCADCYKAFEQKLPPIFRKMHRSERHVGKVPKGHIRASIPDEQTAPAEATAPPRRRRGETKVNKEIETLEIKLKDAVRREDYETAAQLKEKINELKAGGN